jgi:ADP-ribosyl-[dinitrogen reductase] hydrolase
VSELGDWIAERYGYEIDSVIPLRSGGFDVSAAGTVPPALAAACTAKDWEGAVRTAIGLGGDTDTLGCIAGAVAEAIHGVPPMIAARARAHLTDDLTRVLARFEQRRSGCVA